MMTIEDVNSNSPLFPIHLDICELVQSEKGRHFVDFVLLGQIAPELVVDSSTSTSTSTSTSINSDCSNSNNKNNVRQSPKNESKSKTKKRKAQHENKGDLSHFSLVFHKPLII
jgi:hypothetical protein